jgi:HSP20 family protein
MEPLYDSLLEITRLQSEVNRLFDLLLASRKGEGEELTGRWRPNVDIVETKEDLVIHVETPGLDRGDLSLKITGSQISIAGKKPLPDHRGKDKTRFICMERAYGKFERSLYIHCPINSHKATASLKDGLLTVRVPKIEDRRGEQVQIAIVSGPDEEAP